MVSMHADKISDALTKNVAWRGGGEITFTKLTGSVGASLSERSTHWPLITLKTPRSCSKGHATFFLFFLTLGVAIILK